MSHSSSSESSDEDGWLDTNPGDDEEPQTVISLVDDRVFPDVPSMLAYCKDERQFDFVGLRDRLGLDFYGSVKLINYVRQRAHDGLPVSGDIAVADFDHEQYLKPVLEDDALIFGLDSLPEPAAAPEAVPEAPAGTAGASTASPADDLQQKNAVLQSELDSLTKQFENYRLAVQKTLDQRWGVDEDGQPSKADATDKAGKTEKKSSNDYYFESYSYNDIHETMLKDAVRTDAYRDFIYGNKHLFAGKTVLDIGCGTGILSMFCAKAGAKRVIAVDRSAIIQKARENVFHNGLEGQITCLQGLIEEVTLPVAQVDIIVSEWMGYALLYEAMLPSVLYARDRYLAPDGLLVPSHASLWVAPVCDSEYVCDSITFWRDVYGFDMKPMQDGIYDDTRVVVLPPARLCGEPCMFRLLDLHTVRAADLVFDAAWQTTLAATGADSLDGFLVWFDMYFGTSRTATVEPATGVTAAAWQAAGGGRENGCVAFSTGPFTPETHWRQILLLAKSHSKPLAASLADGRKLAGTIQYATASDNPRALTLHMTWGPPADAGQEQDKHAVHKQAWALN